MIRINRLSFSSTREKFCALFFGILGRSHGMSNRPIRRKDLIVISALERLITKEMNLIVISLLQILETISLIPPGGKDIERDLTTDAEGEIKIRKLLLHRGDHIFANAAREINLFVVVAFFSRAITADRTDVHHATAEFNECSSLHWNINVGQILHRPIDNALDIVLAQKLGYGLHLLKLSILVCHETILGKIVGENMYNAFAELFLLLGQIRPSHDTDGDLFGE
mmetsp:Transcript_24707/g.59566  ORF Transcript_24707/g.59566 Transcript_24707/m.59566 type:complete len:225 (+) Transcript_24707:291-965(+)